MKNPVSKLFALVAVMVMLAACNSQKENVVKIGLVSPMTGAGAAVADYWINGFNLAIDELNAKSTDVKYEIIFEDCQSDPATAVSCYKRLEMQGVKYIIGFGGQFAMAIAPMTKGKDILYFTVMDYNEKVLDVTDCAFRVYPSAKALGDIASSYLVDSCGLKNFATITLNTVPCLQATQVFSENIAKIDGASITFQDNYDIGTFDFKNTVNKMSEKECDGVFINGFGISPASFANQMSYVKKFDNVTMFGDVNLATVSFSANNKNEKMTIYYADADIKEGFAHTYLEKYNNSANSYASCSYMLPYLIDAARNGVQDVSDIASQREFLRGNTIETLASDITFDERGNGEMKMSVHKLQ